MYDIREYGLEVGDIVLIKKENRSGIVSSIQFKDGACFFSVKLQNPDEKKTFSLSELQLLFPIG